MSAFQSLKERLVPGVAIRDAVESSRNSSPMLSELSSDMIELDYMVGTQYGPEAHDQTLAAHNRITKVTDCLTNYINAGIVDAEIFANQGAVESNIGQSAAQVEV